MNIRENPWLKKYRKDDLMTTLYLCGAGNPEGVRLALNINKAQNRWDQIVILDDDHSKHGQSIVGVGIVEHEKVKAL